jgi:uncharacterized protein (TIGR02453 family)
MTISKATISFLTDLKANNNKDWFLANKPRFEAAKLEFEQFIQALINQIGQFDPQIAHHTAKECIFRIYRDVRFSADKSPYKTHFGAHFTAAVNKSEIHTKAGYYIHLEAGGSFLAGGAYVPEAVWLKAIRSEIHYNGKLFHSILDNTDFKQYFGTMSGEKLVRPPKDYPIDHPDIELLKHKSFLATHQCTDKMVLGNAYLNHCTKVFRALKPFDDFLNMAMD